MNKLRFEGRVAIVTGAGGGLGRAYALLLASRGCAVVVNDLGGSRSGEGASHRAADIVVKEIIEAGGKATANYDSVENGERIVQKAISEYGRLDIVINNAGILRDKSFAKMTDEDWDLIYSVHVQGAFKVTKAAWEIFQKQNYGRIVMTTSAAGLYGNYGQTNYGSAKLALVGFGKSLAREGAKKNIHCNIFAPVAGSRITETVLPADLIDKLKPEYVAPFVAYLCHESCSENGSLYEIGAGFAAKVRWERSNGALLKVDDPTFSPSAVAAAMENATSFSNPKYPQSMSDNDWVKLLEQSKRLPPNRQGKALRYDGRVALVTGAGGGLGRCYALMLAGLGAKVVVNDLGRNSEGKMLADLVVGEIKAGGGVAIANYDSVENGDSVVESVIKKYERIDIIINNAGILRDKSFAKMSEREWNSVMSIHTRGTFKIIKAAWPFMVKQNYGRIVNTTSAVGLYGNFGQANYSCAKAAILGFSMSLAAEGKRNNIIINSIAPNAGTQMTATILPKDIVDILKPEYVAPIVGFLTHESNQMITGAVFEVGSGWFAQVRWQRSEGFRLNPLLKEAFLEEVASKWPRFNDFSGKGVYYPRNAQESFSSIVALIASNDDRGSSPLKESSKSSEAPVAIQYTRKDMILYNIGIGCSEKELEYVFEGHPDFCVIPTFGVIPAFSVIMNTRMDDYVAGYNPALLLHGEHFIEVIKTIPVEEKLRSEGKVLQVLPKGKGCIVVIQVKTFNESGDLIMVNEGTIFLRNATPKTNIDDIKARNRQALESCSIPDRNPDAVITEKVADNQAAIYRLCGDYNPIHIDPSFAELGGFPKPILHGLCSFGRATRHVLKAFANGDPKMFKAVKARFTKHVFPGETVRTEMWRQSSTRIVFQMRVVERDEICIGNAFIDLHSKPANQREESSKPSLSSNDESNETSKASALFSRYAATFESLPIKVKEDQIKKVNSIFQIEVKKNGKIETYQIDLKNLPGKIGKGPASKADVTISVNDDDFLELASGRINGQQAYMKGLIKLRGNMVTAMKLDNVLKTLSANPRSKV